MSEGFRDRGLRGLGTEASGVQGQRPEGSRDRGLRGLLLGTEA